MDLVLRYDGDPFELTFPSQLVPATPCGWLIAVPVANNTGAVISLQLSVFDVQCPSALIVYNGSSAQGTKEIWRLCGDSAPLATPPTIQIPG